MDKDKLKCEILPRLERVIKFSLINNLNIHSSLGGKYGELFVAYNLWSHEPKLARERYEVKDVKKPGSCDIVLAKTKKRIEVKWSMLHHRLEDPVMRGFEEISFWGWGFSKGTQFKKDKFDYCILLAAKKDEALPKHIFVIKRNEMTELIGKERKSALGGRSYFIEFSNNEDFYNKRKWSRGKSLLESSLFKDRSKYETRWKELIEKGLITK